MLTFEFPTAEQALSFAGRVLQGGAGVPARSHRVVDVQYDADDPFSHDLLVLMARYHGATVSSGEAPERLYTLLMWERDDDVHLPDVTLTTLAEFSANNPDLALAVIQTIEREGTFTGGGGASPSWRITRTPFVGKREG